jgi:hypothetical protein
MRQRLERSCLATNLDSAAQGGSVAAKGWRRASRRGRHHRRQRRRRRIARIVVHPCSPSEKGMCPNGKKERGDDRPASRSNTLCTAPLRSPFRSNGKQLCTGGLLHMCSGRSTQWTRPRRPWTAARVRRTLEFRRDHETCTTNDRPIIEPRPRTGIYINDISLRTGQTNASSSSPSPHPSLRRACVPTSSNLRKSLTVRLRQGGAGPACCAQAAAAEAVRALSAVRP